MQGATTGSAIQRRLSWLFRDKDGQALLVAGAAAGVSAVFQAPATGGCLRWSHRIRAIWVAGRYSQRCCRALRAMDDLFWPQRVG